MDENNIPVPYNNNSPGPHLPKRSSFRVMESSIPVTCDRSTFGGVSPLYGNGNEQESTYHFMDAGKQSQSDAVYEAIRMANECEFSMVTRFSRLLSLTGGSSLDLHPLGKSSTYDTASSTPLTSYESKSGSNSGLLSDSIYDYYSENRHTYSSHRPSLSGESLSASSTPHRRNSTDSNNYENSCNQCNNQNNNNQNYNHNNQYTSE